MQDIKEAIISFHYAERIKSELIIAAKLIDHVGFMSDEERSGAEKLLLFFLQVLLGEILIARNASGMNAMEEARLNLEESIRRVRLKDYDKAVRMISSAITSATTGGEKAAVMLKERGLI